MSNDEYQHQMFCKQPLPMKHTKELAINVLIRDLDSSRISDGHHTFGELYAHRNKLFVLIARRIKQDNTHHVWRSVKHSDGTMEKGWFIMGINKEPGDQITYHLPIDLWDETMFAETLDKAPVWDGHEAPDVLTRLNTL